MIPAHPTVHVGGPGRECAVGIVLRPGEVSLVRVIRPSSFALIGSLDEEGDLRHASDPVWVPTPDGEPRLLDSWHEYYRCRFVRYPLPAPVDDDDA